MCRSYDRAEQRTSRCLRALIARSWYTNAANKHIVPALGALRLDQLNSNDIEIFYSRCVRDMSPHNFRRIHVTLRKALEAAVKRKLIAGNPVDELDVKPRTPIAAESARRKAQTPSDIKHLLDAVSGHRLAAALRVMAATGCRRGELLALAWADLDLDEGAVTIRRAWIQVDGVPGMSTTKSGRIRRVYIGAGTVAALRQHRREQLEERLAWGASYIDQGLVFAKENGEPIRPDYFTRWVKRVSDKAGLEPITPHSFRHTAGTWGMEAGVATPVVSEMLGHSSTRVTEDIYQHVRAPMQQRTATFLDELMDGTQETNEKHLSL